MKRKFRDPQGRKVPRGDGHRTFAPALRQGRLRVMTPAGEGGWSLGEDWKQPGRRFGPRPTGVNPPKRNKVIDADGNARTAPLSMLLRHSNYVGNRRTFIREAAYNPVWFEGFNAVERASKLGVTPRQRRRIEHKDHHARAPFGGRS